MKKVIFLIFITFLSLNAKEITLQSLANQPKGISRDFYIWLFLQQDITPKEAQEAYQMVFRKNPKLFNLYYQKGDNKLFSRETICQQMPTKELITQDSQCIAYGLTLKKAESLDEKTLQNLAKKLQQEDKNLSISLEILASKEPFKKLLQTNAKIFSSFYFESSQDYKKIFNTPLPKEILTSYLAQNHAPFLRLLRQNIINQQMPLFNQSLTQVSPQEILDLLDSETSFYLGLNSVKHNKTKDSLKYFLHSSKKAKHAFNKNRGLFWAYLITKDKSYLNTLSQSKFVDVYTLASLEITKNPAQFDLIYDIKTPSTLAKWDTKNPFEWERIRDSYKENPTPTLLQKVQHSNTKPHLVWLEKQAGKEYFLKPYPEVFKSFQEDTQALLYALGRQESLFIPTAISTSYALGVMQLMPFNVTALAKKFKEEDKINFLDMFDPAINIPYAEYFTRPLIKEFKHPLFVAYAYNGGSGFTRRLLATKQLFKKDNPLDPWYSMELIPYEETRIYGKKVLANYIIYQKSFGKEISLLNSLQQTLIY